MLHISECDIQLWSIPVSAIKKIYERYKEHDITKFIDFLDAVSSTQVHSQSTTPANKNSLFLEKHIYKFIFKFLKLAFKTLEIWTLPIVVTLLRPVNSFFSSSRFFLFILFLNMSQEY